MFHAYMTAMLLILTAGVACTLLSETHLALAGGLGLMTLGGGGLSAGWMTRPRR